MTDMPTNGGRAAAGIVDSLKTQPLSLALVIMNVGLLLLFYFIVQSAENRQKIVAEQQTKLHELLARCQSN